MLPPPRAFIAGAACLMPKNTLVSRTSIVWCHSVAVVSSSGPDTPPKPALLWITSSPPQRSTASATASATCPSSTTLTCRKAAASPSESARA